MRKRKIGSVGTASLKAVAAQYLLTEDMLSQVESLNTDFEVELNSILIEYVNEYEAPQKKLEQSNHGATELQKPLEQESDNNRRHTNSSQEGTDSEDFLEMGDDSTPPWMKKLFKRIALHCHPDKIMPMSDMNYSEKHDRLNMFDRARTALEEINQPALLAIGLKYDEKPADFSVSKLKKIIADGTSSRQAELDSIRKRTTWIWGMSEEDVTVKAKVLVHATSALYNIKTSVDFAIRFLNTHYFGSDEPKRKPGQHPGQRLAQRRKNVN